MFFFLDFNVATMISDDPAMRNVREIQGRYLEDLHAMLFTIVILCGVEKPDQIYFDTLQVSTEQKMTQ